MRTTWSPSDELLALSGKAIRLSALHVALALATAAWLADALFVIELALLQRLRLKLIALGLWCIGQGGRARRELPKAWESMPKSLDELGTSVNYQLNMVGLEMEKTMTDAWAKYLRQRQKWMKGGGGKGGGKGGNGGLKNWWDLQTMRAKNSWVSWQIDSTKQKRKGGAAETEGRAEGKTKADAKPRAEKPHAERNPRRARDDAHRAERKAPPAPEGAGEDGAAARQTRGWKWPHEAAREASKKAHDEGEGAPSDAAAEATESPKASKKAPGSSLSSWFPWLGQADADEPDTGSVAGAAE